MQEENCKKECFAMKQMDYSGMSEKELLTELLKSQKKDTRNEKVSAIANAVLAVILLAAAVILIPRTVKALGELDSVVTEAQAVVEQAGPAIDQVNAAMREAETAMKNAQETLAQGSFTLGKVNRAVDGINSLVDQNASTLTDAMRKIDQVDFAGLNTSIRSLAEVLEPLRNFFGAFSR